jgi:hypothetical protein
VGDGVEDVREVDVVECAEQIAERRGDRLAREAERDLQDPQIAPTRQPGGREVG